MFNSIGTFLSTVGLGIASYLGLWSPPTIQEPIVIIQQVKKAAELQQIQQIQNEINRIRQVIQQLQETKLGANNSTLPIAGTTYNLSGAGVSSSATSLTLASLTLPQTGLKLLDADFSSTFYLTLEPGNRTRQEIVSCTTVVQNSAGTATLSGCARGLSPITPYTASTTLQFAHGGGTQVIFSDPPQLFSQFYALGNNATSTNVLAFSSTTPPHYDITMQNANQYGSSSQFASKGYVDGVSIAGASVANNSTQGLVTTATKSQVASSTASGTGPGGSSYVISTNVATSTCGSKTGSGNTYVTVTQDNGYLDQNCINLSENFAFTGRNVTNTGTTSFQSPVTFDNTRFYATSTKRSEINYSILNYASTTAVTVADTASTSVMVISNECVGCFKYTGSSTALTLTAGTNDMAGIPALANFGIASWTITDSSNAACVNRGTLFIAREGVTAATAQAMDGSSDGACDGGYTFTFTGSTNTFSVGEIVDTTADSSLSGTIYWYR